MKRHRNDDDIYEQRSVDHQEELDELQKELNKHIKGALKVAHNMLDKVGMPINKITLTGIVIDSLVKTIDRVIANKIRGRYDN